MTRRIGFNKAIAGVVIAGAMSLTSVFGSVAFAGTGITIGPGELQECTISKSMDAAADTDGRDFLTWQRTTGAIEDQPTEEVAFYYNKIAFQYAATTDSSR